MLRQRLRAARANDEGFTLIELLIVVVILGVLAGIAVFGVQAFQNDGKDAACNTNKKTLSVAAQAYYAKTGAYPTAIGDLTTNGYLKDVPAGTLTFTAGGAVAPTLACP